MKCSDLKDKLAIYSDGVLSEAECLAVRGHLDICPLCRERYAEYREIGSALRMLGRSGLDLSLRRTIREAVVTEVRKSRRSWIPLAPDVREFLEMRVLPYGAGSLVAVVLCGGFLVLMASGVMRRAPIQTAEPMLAANHGPMLRDGDISAADLVRSRVGLASESPSINPQGALVALTTSFVAGMDSNDEVVVVADVYSDGLAQIAEVVEPPRETRMVSQLEKALDTDTGPTPFVPASIETRPESVRVVLKFRSVDVYARAKRGSRWH